MPLLLVGRCDHLRCTGGADEGKLLVVQHSRMLWRLLRRRRYLLLLLELPEVKDSCMKDVQRSSDSLLISSSIHWHQAIWSLLSPWTTAAS